MYTYNSYNINVLYIKIFIICGKITKYIIIYLKLKNN